jgi:hypothetical protein
MLLTILRLLLDEAALEHFFKAPVGFNPANQGEWNEKLIMFGPKRPIKLESLERTPTRLELVYNLADLGMGEFIIESEKVRIAHI